MKKLYSLLLFISFSLASNAQKTTPIIKPGTTIDILVKDGREIPIRVTIKHLGDTLDFSWQENNANAITAKGKKSATKVKKDTDNISKYFIQPHQEGILTVRLQNDETLITLSKAAYRDLTLKKKVTYKGNQYLVVHDKGNFTMQHTNVDATYLQSDDYSNYMWVLNNADFPLILEIKSKPVVSNASFDAVMKHPELVRQTIVNYTVTDIN